MATTLLITNFNTMLISKQNEHIMQRSKNAHLLKFFVPEKYGEEESEWDMNDFTFSLEFALPSGEYHTAIVDKEDVSTKEGYVQYNYMLPPKFTIFAGDIAIQPTFTYVDHDTAITYVRKIEGCNITVTSIEQWSMLVTDDALGAIDQALVKVEAQINALESISGELGSAKADDHMINEDGQLVLMANGKQIGRALDLAVVEVPDGDDESIDGIIDISGKYDHIMI